MTLALHLGFLPLQALGEFLHVFHRKRLHRQGAGDFCPGKTVLRPGSLVRAQPRNLNRLFGTFLKEIAEQFVFCFVFLQSNLYKTQTLGALINLL